MQLNQIVMEFHFTIFIGQTKIFNRANKKYTIHEVQTFSLRKGKKIFTSMRKINSLI